KYSGAAGLLIASSDLVAELIAQSPKGNPLTSQFKGLSDVALGEAKKIGCTYADIRFTRSVTSGVNASGGPHRDPHAARVGGGGGGRGGEGRGRWGGGRAGGGGLGRPRDPQRRVGVCEQPDRHRGRDPPHHAHRRRHREGERGREESRRQARARSGLHGLLV